MAINTIKATMQMRRGAEQDFDSDQMTAGEWAVSTDSKKVWMCFAPGIVRRMATYEAFEEDMKAVQQILATCQDIQEAVEAFERLAEQHSMAAAGSAHDADGSAQDAAGSADGARAAMDAAEGYRDEAADSAAAAAGSAQAAEGSKDAAKISETNAAASATESAISVTESAGFADESEEWAGKSAESATIAEGHKDAAALSETEAKTAADNAKVSEDEAKDWSERAKSYAVGTEDEYRPGDSTDSSKYYYEQSKRLVQGYEGIMPMGTITFADLDNPDNQVPKYMFNISDGFISDDRFNDGGGKEYGPGMNVFYTMDGKWDVMTSASVLGVKGRNEETFRQGNVVLTPENVGAIPETYDIPQGSDLNLYKTPGLYSKLYEDITLNVPTISSGSLIVTRAGSNTRQLFFSANLANGIFERYYDANHGWQPWNRLIQGVKGDAEEDYRTGFVNLTKEDLGIGIASSEEAGLIKVDGQITTVDENGVLQVDIPEATIDYNQLENRPSVGGTILEGDKTLGDLGGAEVKVMTVEEFDALPEGKDEEDVIYFLEDGVASSPVISEEKFEKIETGVKDLAEGLEGAFYALKVQDGNIYALQTDKADKSTVDDLSTSVESLETTKANVDGILLQGDVTGVSQFDAETGKTIIPTQRRGCITGWGSGDNPVSWYNYGTIITGDSYSEYSLTLFVNQSFGDVNYSGSGILRLHIRYNKLNPIVSLTWILSPEMGSFYPPNFVVLSKLENDGYHVRHDLWVKRTGIYEIYTFEVLDEILDYQKVYKTTFYSSDLDKIAAELPEGYDTVISSLATIQNPTTRLTGLYAVSRYIHNTNTANLKTRFSMFGEGNRGLRQSIFIFGRDNGTSMYGVLVVDGFGENQWIGQGTLSAEKVDSPNDGTITIILPNTAYDTFSFLSPEYIN